MKLNKMQVFKQKLIQTGILLGGIVEKNSIGGFS